MGSHCSKLCDSALPNFRRHSHGAPTRVGASSRPTSQAPASRVEALRGSTASVIFKEGFALGLKVRKLQAMLEALDAPNERRAQHQVPHMPVEQEEGSEFSSDEPANAVSLDGNVPVEVEDESLEFVRKIAPHPLTNFIKEDFKPWLRIMHHPGSPDSLP